MTFSPAPRQDTAASIVGGLLGGLAVAGSVLAFFALNDPRGSNTDESMSELRIAVAELRTQVAELRTEVATRPQPPQPPAPPPMMLYPPPAPPPPPAPLVEISMTQPKPALDAISCSQEHRCTIDRAYVMELVANPSALVHQMRIIPSVKDGQTVGLKLYGIRHGSMPNLLGYKNGDLILSINGMPVNSPEATIGTYSRLRSADTFSVELERKGQRLFKTCDLR